MMEMNAGKEKRAETLTEKKLKLMADEIQNLAHNLDSLKDEVAGYLAPDSPNCGVSSSPAQKEKELPEQKGSQLTDTLTGLTQSIEVLTVGVLNIRDRLR